MIEPLTQALPDLPAWAYLTAAAAVVIVAVVLVYRMLGAAARAWWHEARTRRREERDRMREAGKEPRGPLATLVDSWTLIVGYGGMTVSMWGLWRFADDQAHLPTGLRIAFVGILDGAEVGLFLGLFLAVRMGAREWTLPMRRSHRLAWALVGLSAVAQVAEAETLWGKAAMGMVPILSGALIQHRLTAILAANRPAEEDETGRPGPVRLLSLVWGQLWTAVFDHFGLDAGATSGAQARRAQVRRAVRLTLVHRAALARYETTKKGTSRRGAKAAGRAYEELEKARHRAQLAREQAEIAADPAQKLAYMRGLAWGTAGDDVADLDYQNTREVLAMMDRLALTDTEALAEAEERARRAEEDANRSQAARQEAEEAAASARQEEADAREAAADARQEAEHEEERAKAARQSLGTAREEQGTARKEAETARRMLAEAVEKVEAARQEEADAREAAKTARQETDGARRLLDDLKDRAGRARRQLEDAESKRGEHVDEIEHLRRQARQIDDGIRQASDARKRHTEAFERAESARQEAEEKAAAAVRRTAALKAQAIEAQAVLRSLGAAVADHLGENPEDMANELPAPGEPMFRSPDKERAWLHFRELKRTQGIEPKAAELAWLGGGVAESRARAWLSQFRQLHPRVIAGEAERDGHGAEHSRAGETPAPSTAEQTAMPRQGQPSAHWPAPSTAEQTHNVNGHPVGV